MRGENGEEAIEKYRKVQPDVVLVDLSMPVMDEVLKVIRSVMAGRRGIPPAVAAKLAEHSPRIRA